MTRQEITVYPMNGDTLATNCREATAYDIVVRDVLSNGDHRVHEQYGDLHLNDMAAQLHQLERRFPEHTVDWIEV